MMCFEELESRPGGSDTRRSAGHVVHLDGELLEVVDARVQLGHQHEEVGSLVVTMSL